MLFMPGLSNEINVIHTVRVRQCQKPCLTICFTVLSAIKVISIVISGADPFSHLLALFLTTSNRPVRTWRCKRQVIIADLQIVRPFAFDGIQRALFAAVAEEAVTNLLETTRQ